MYISPIESIITILTRDDCLICKISEGPICELCFADQAEDAGSRCYKCNKLTKQNSVCLSCKSKLRRVWWAGVYGGELKELITQMKLGRKRAIARQVGKYLADNLPYLDQDTIVVPVPTAQKRVRRRGFDHSILIARHFADKKALPYQHILRRISNVDQIGKRRAVRIAQMKDSFELKSGIDIRGRSLLLVDDVLTTGATLESSAALLRKSGASHVDAVVIARHLLK